MTNAFNFFALIVALRQIEGGTNAWNQKHTEYGFAQIKPCVAQDYVKDITSVSIPAVLAMQVLEERYDQIEEWHATRILNKIHTDVVQTMVQAFGFAWKHGMSVLNKQTIMTTEEADYVDRLWNLYLEADKDHTKEDLPSGNKHASPPYVEHETLTRQDVKSDE